MPKTNRNNLKGPNLENQLVISLASAQGVTWPRGVRPKMNSVSKKRGLIQPDVVDPATGDEYYRSLLKPDKIIRVAVTGDVFVTKLGLQVK